jgi:hypothetical protein
MVAACLITIVTAALFAKTRDYGLMGWDTYPVIASSRVESVTDFAGNFTEQLMEGRHPEGFYRPVLNLTIALDYALWGLRPFGYQLTSVLLFACCAAALYVLIGRMAGGDSLVAPLLALAFFLLHSSNVEVLPVPSRRPEVLCCLFMLLSLGSQLSPGSLAARRLPILPAVFALLAVTSKETGFVLPVISFVAVFLYSPRPTRRKRLLHGLTAVVPVAGALGAALAARIAIIGGIGGARSADPTQVFAMLPRAFSRIFEYVLAGQPAMRESLVGTWMLVMLVGWLVLTGLLMLRSRRSAETGDVLATRLKRLMLVALIWIITIGVAYAATGKIRPWYVLMPATGFAMLIGAMSGWLCDLWRSDRGPVRAAAFLLFIVPVAFVFWQVCYSPAVRDYDEWQRATVVGDAFLNGLKARIESTPDGSVIEARPVPIWAEPSRGGLVTRGAAIMTDYTIEAWGELMFPGRSLRVWQVGQAPPGRAAPDEVLVLLTERLEGY